MTPATTFARRYARVAGVAALAAMCAGLALAQAPQSAAVQCPQPRATERAPASYYSLANPLPATAENIERGRQLYQNETRPATCASCHGVDGRGNGPQGVGLTPPPRNFACAQTMSAIPDGQLFWVIQNGAGDYHQPARQGAQEIERPARRSRFTAMRAYRDTLSETDIWQLVLYLRTQARAAPAAR